MPRGNWQEFGRFRLCHLVKLKLELLELLRSWAPLRMNGKQPAHESEYCNLDVQSGAKLSFLQEVAVMINTGVVNPNLSMQDR